MSADDLNAALVEEFKRLGSREPIDKVLRSEPFQVQSIIDLHPEQYQSVLDAVRAVSV